VGTLLHNYTTKVLVLLSPDEAYDWRNRVTGKKELYRQQAGTLEGRNSCLKKVICPKDHRHETFTGICGK
jgi:hypothetical protein